MSCGMSLSIITAKILFLSSPLISLCCEFVKGFSYTKTDISVGGNCLTDVPVEVK
jgi:hypothetical protein